MIAAPRLNKLSLVLLTGIGLAGPSSSVLAQGMGGPDSPRMGMGMERMAERVKERCEQFEARLASMDKKLSTEQVRDIVAGHLAQSGESHIKAGKAQAKGDGIASVEIVTTDGSLVTTREISTKTGLPVEAGQSCDKIEERIEKVRERGGPGRMGPGPMGPRPMMGPGGRGGAAMALFGVGPDRDLNLSADQVKKLAEARLIIAGNPRLKVGSVKEKDKDTYTVDIVTADNSLVTQREVDKHSGRVER